MKTVIASVLTGLSLFLQSGSTAAPVEPPDLLMLIRTAGIAKLGVSSASVYQDDRSGCLTMTFQYIHGDPEITVPTADLGWPTDWSPFRAIAFTLQSTSLEPIFIQVPENAGKKDVIVEPLEGIRIRGVIPFDVPGTHEKEPDSAPLGYKLFPESVPAPAQVQRISFRMHFPAEPTQVTLCNFRLTRDVPLNDILDRHPVLDRFGQWIPEKWENKAYNGEDLKRFWADEKLQPVNLPSEKSTLCPLGGDAARKRKATGFFRTEKIAEKWVFIDPHGHPFYSAGMDIVGVADPSFATETNGRGYLFEELPPPGPAWLTPGKVVSFYVANLIRRYGDNWQTLGLDHLADRLRDWGFNTLGNWSNKEFASKSQMPYVLPLFGWYTKKILPYPYGLPDVFSDEFQKNVDEAARKEVVDLKDDPNLIGYFLDNEPGWAHDFDLKQPWADTLLEDLEPSATQKELREMLAANPQDGANIKKQFPYECVRKYLEIVTTSVRKYDPNHLILGVRFAGDPGPQWVKLSSLFDVFSINVYSDTFAPDQKKIQGYSEGSGRPVLIGEFTAATPGRGLEGTFYGVHKVRDHIQRGVAYRYFVENSAASPYIIGTHWFQLVDDMPTGRPGDGERLNYGFVNVLDVPYKDLVDAARETHSRLYQLKFGDAKPVQTVPQIN
jgi:hypothetical protein